MAKAKAAEKTEVQFNKQKAEEALKALIANPEKYRKRTKIDDLREVEALIINAFNKGASADAVAQVLNEGGAMTVSAAALRGFRTTLIAEKKIKEAEPKK